MTLRHALRRDIPEVVDIWVDAFTDDPYLRWIAADDAVWAGFGPAWLGFIAALTFERGHTYLSRDGAVAVAWIAPDLSFATPADLERGYGVIASHAGSARADDALATIRGARAHSLEPTHWTLQYLGVRSEAQRRGVGAAAVAPILAVCDAEGLPCGLVSTNPRNVPFYERLGFVVAAEVPTPDGATALRPMHRPGCAD